MLFRLKNKKQAVKGFFATVLFHIRAKIPRVTIYRMVSVDTSGRNIGVALWKEGMISRILNALIESFPPSILIWTMLLLTGYTCGDLAARTTKRIFHTFSSTEVAI